jgi:CHAT domain
MTRGVFVVKSVGKGARNLLYVDEAFGWPAPQDAFELSCSSSDPEFLKLRTSKPDVRKAGRRVYESLAEHEPVQTLLNHVAQSGAAAVHPLFVRVDAPDAEGIPWETLCNGSFMALDPPLRSPIARLTAGPQPPARLDRFISGELRFAIVLGAASVSGEEEWISVASVLEQCPVPADILVLVSEDRTRDRVKETEKQWRAAGLPHKVTVDFIDGSTLIERLRAHIPNIVHFFCHGFADVTPLLELETRADRRAGRSRGSISIGSGHMMELCRRKSLWGIVLNCCVGARPAPQIHSMACELVNNGAAAVVAMRESVDAGDANLFANEFYTSLLQQLRAYFEHRDAMEVTPFEDLVWVRAVHGARQKLVQHHGDPDQCAVWTFPVVYVHRDGMTLRARELRPMPEKERLRLTSELDFYRNLRGTYEFSADSQDIRQQRKNVDDKIQAIEDQITV